jgi:hypothetical protein
VGSGVANASLAALLARLPQIHDADHHSLGYPEDGSAFRMHSTPSQPYRAPESPQAALDRLEREDWDPSYFTNLRDLIHEQLLTQDVRPPEPPERSEFAGPLADIAATLDQRVGANYGTVFMTTAHNTALRRREGTGVSSGDGGLSERAGGRVTSPDSLRVGGRHGVGC